MELARTVLRDELKNALTPLKGKKPMVIAHSMGTIIAYDVLRDMGQKDKIFEVPYLVTIGSPLGLTHVKKNIYQERSYSDVRLRTPTIVSRRWVNFSDPKDMVAVDPYLRDDYKANDGGVRVEDDLGKNDYKGLSGERNHHKSYGYLRTPEISAVISEFLNS